MVPNCPIKKERKEGTSSAAMLVSTCGAMCGQRFRYAAAADWDFASFFVAAFPYLLHIFNYWRKKIFVASNSPNPSATRCEVCGLDFHGEFPSPVLPNFLSLLLSHAGEVWCWISFSEHDRVNCETFASPKAVFFFYQNSNLPKSWTNTTVPNSFKDLQSLI